MVMFNLMINEKVDWTIQLLRTVGFTQLKMINPLHSKSIDWFLYEGNTGT